MLNMILIFSMIFNLAVGFLVIGRLESIFGRGYGIIVPKKTVIRDTDFLGWGHSQLYLPAAWEEGKEE